MSSEPALDPHAKRIRKLEEQVAALQAEARRYRTLFDAFPVGITIADYEGKVVETNPAAERLLSVEKAEHERRELSGPQWHLIRPDGSNMSSDELAGVIALREGRPVLNQEMGVITNEGVTWINVSAAPLPPEDGGVVITYNDVTERRHIEEALAASEKNFRTLVEAAPMAIFMAEDGKYTYANPTGVDMLGFGSCEDIMGTNVLETIHPSSRKSIVERLRAIEEGKDNPPLEIEVRKPDGESVWSRTASVAMTLNGKQVAVIVGQDVTARKKSEEELLEKEAFLTSVYRGVDLSVFVLDVAGDGSFRYVGLNPKHELLTGIASDEIAGKTPVDVLPADTAAAVCERYRACVEAGETISYEEWLSFKDKSTCWETRLHRKRPANPCGLGTRGRQWRTAAAQVCGGWFSFQMSGRSSSSFCTGCALIRAKTSRR